ncbi:hypothetical protein WN990_15925 [Kitasatospora purpeofusca]
MGGEEDEDLVRDLVAGAAVAEHLGGEGAEGLLVDQEVRLEVEGQVDGR